MHPSQSTAKIPSLPASRAEAEVEFEKMSLTPSWFTEMNSARIFHGTAADLRLGVDPLPEQSRLHATLAIAG